MTQEKGRYIQRLHRIHGKKPFKRDVFGRRKATAREIEAAVSQDFAKKLENHLPGDRNIETKIEGGDNY